MVYFGKKQQGGGTTPAGSATLAGNNTFTGNNTFNNPIVVPQPTQDNQAANKQYVDNALANKADTTALANYAGLAADNTFTGTNTFNNPVVVPQPTNNNEATNKEYVDNALTNKADTSSITQLNNNYNSLSNYVDTVSLKNVVKNQPITTGQTWDGVPITALYYDNNVNFQDGEITLPNLNGVRHVFITDLYLWDGDNALKFPYVNINQNNAIVSHARFVISTNSLVEQIKIISKGLSGSRKITGWIFYWKRG